MVRRDGAEARKERMHKIAQFIQANLHSQGELVFSKTRATLQYELGLTKERVDEYLEILEQIGEFEIDRDTDRIRKIKPAEKDV
jgi:hypothetical protein